MKGSFLTLLGRLLVKLRYRVRIEGLDAVLAKGTGGLLILPNHPAYIDPVILLTHLFPYFRPHIMADKDNMARPIVRHMVDRLGIKPIPDPKLHGAAALKEVAEVIQHSIDELRRGENYMLYPAGRIYQSRYEHLGSNSAVETILQEVKDVRVLLVRTTGLWGSSFSRAVDRHPDWMKGFVRGAKALLANLIFFSPRREVKIELFEPADFPHGQGRLAMNRYMENFYNQDAPPARYVPYTIWESGGVRDLPEPVVEKVSGDSRAVPASIREPILAKIGEMTGKASIEDSAQLAADLGMDSLGKMELLIWIEQQFGHAIANPDALQTVGDCLLAASGQAGATTEAPLKRPQPSWFHSRMAMQIPAGDTVAEVFLRQLARDPNRAALADQTGGQKSYRDLLTAILVLKPHIEKIAGSHVGVMLPASGAAATVYLATLFAGKVPVMVNWTAGSRNLAHGLTLLGVDKVLTSSQLVSKVESMGSDLSAIRKRFWMLEDLGKTLGKGEKLAAFLRARIGWHGLSGAKLPETAAVIFTSGSENLPKAVPLSHHNLLTNLRDLIQIFPLETTDRMIGFLPPFHSFGLTGTMLLPLCAGIPVTYFPNPTDGGMLARISEAYGVSMLIGTPTFLSGIVRSASDQQLAGLRMVLTGAEKCPESLYDVLERRWPQMKVLEGYGITECSPVLSVNTLDAPRRGTIGKPLPSVEHVIVDLDSGQPVAAGQSGMLLVRGPSIFGGYLNYAGDSPFVEFAGKSWYRTGDLVKEDEAGSLVFTGRLKRFVKLGGEMVSLPAVEDALLAAFTREDDQEAPLAVEATPSESMPELVLFAIRDISRDEANTVLGKAGLSPLHFIRQVRRVEKIPVLGTGKTDYRALKGLLA